MRFLGGEEAIEEKRTLFHSPINELTLSSTTWVTEERRMEE